MPDRRKTLPLPSEAGRSLLGWTQKKERFFAPLGSPRTFSVNGMTTQSTFSSNVISQCLCIVTCLGVAAFGSGQARASELNIPPEASEAIHLMYSGQTESGYRACAQTRSREARPPARLSDRGRHPVVENLLPLAGAKIQHNRCLEPHAPRDYGGRPGTRARRQGDKPR